ncbi:homogentisate phytyltransferase 1 [Citrus sinensis]|uniref:Homogentisate phytyltransferase 1 n=1 Tax=Citrus sinensis TaxID=2711 RepID=A0ACB8NLX0_CITSI|nr:homogentisate phytyltransferase 1 [Citrus sinensis]KAH9798881.1 homogentisate phytyltransferase 1 [Citrus sinensis]
MNICKVEPSLGESGNHASNALEFELLSKIPSFTKGCRNCKPFNSHRAPVTLQDGYASKSEDDDHSNSFLNVFLKKFHALYRFMRAYACAGVIIATTSNSLLPVQTLADLTPAYFTGLMEALVPAVLMHIYVVAINQLSDVEVDKVNKPYLPLASGEISMGTGIAITLASALMLPLLRWKGNSFLAAFCMVSLNGLLTQFPVYVHIQKYVLGRPLEIFTRPLMFATAFISCFCVVIAFIKDLHDVDGDKKFGIKTLSVMLGKERVFRLSVSMLSIAYGAAVVVGASSPFLANKLITVGYTMLNTSLSHLYAESERRARFSAPAFLAFSNDGRALLVL